MAGGAEEQVSAVAAFYDFEVEDVNERAIATFHSVARSDGFYPIAVIDLGVFHLALTVKNCWALVGLMGKLRASGPRLAIGVQGSARLVFVQTVKPVRFWPLWSQWRDGVGLGTKESRVSQRAVAVATVVAAIAIFLRVVISGVR